MLADYMDSKSKSSYPTYFSCDIHQTVSLILSTTCVITILKINCIDRIACENCQQGMCEITSKITKYIRAREFLLRMRVYYVLIYVSCSHFLV